MAAPWVSEFAVAVLAQGDTPMETNVVHGSGGSLGKLVRICFFIPFDFTAFPPLALEADLFEASHTHKLKGREEYLTIVEAQAPGRRWRRHYKAYHVDRLEAPWRGLADSLAKPFAARENVNQSAEWTANISHGELLRSGVDEGMEVDPANLRFLFQGVSEPDYDGKKYGGIPWRLGLLEQEP